MEPATGTVLLTVASSSYRIIPMCSKLSVILKTYNMYVLNPICDTNPTKYYQGAGNKPNLQLQRPCKYNTVK